MARVPSSHVEYCRVRTSGDDLSPAIRHRRARRIQLRIGGANAALGFPNAALGLANVALAALESGTRLFRRSIPCACFIRALTLEAQFVDSETADF